MRLVSLQEEETPKLALPSEGIRRPPPQAKRRAVTQPAAFSDSSLS